jgi:hypothetical protein
MPLETATYITSLVITNPDGSDQKSTADDHIRLIKACLKRSWPLIDGAVSLSHTQLMLLADLSASVQAQLNALRDGSATAANALYANSASYAANANNAANFNGQNANAYARIAVNNAFVVRQDIYLDGEALRFQMPANNSSHMAWWNSNLSQRFGYMQMSANLLLINNEQGAGVIHLQAPLGVLINSGTAWHSGNDGPNSGLNADLLDGYDTSEAPLGSTIAARNSAGYIFAAYFNQNSNESENPNVASIFVSNGDGFLRKATPAYLGTALETRNISGKAGTQKTVSSSAPSGGNDGDIWYQI